MLRRTASPYLDGYAANSSIPTAPSGSTSRTRANPGGFPSGNSPTRDFRCHPSCDSPCVVCRRLSCARLACGPLELLESPLLRPALQALPPEKTNRCSNLHDACCNPPNSDCPLLQLRQYLACISRRWIDVSYRTHSSKNFCKTQSHVSVRTKRAPPHFSAAPSPGSRIVPILRHAQAVFPTSFAQKYLP